MTRYGIADIGSNTVVLLVYEVNGKDMRQLKYISTPVHLISYVSSRTMSREGIEKAAAVLKEYASILDEMQVEMRFADVTEPCRISNREELIGALAESGFEIYPLSGEQEALCDYEGAMLFYPDVRDGIAFDVGGGSTELIAFKDGKATDAMSFPLGCVRLARLPLDTERCKEEIMKAREEYPGLNVSVKTVIGIGGTARAAGLVCESAYGDRHRIRVSDLTEAFELIRDGDPYMNTIVQRVVDPSRIPVFLPGIHMILEICRCFGAETVLISDTGIREGFLMERIRNLNKND